MSLKDKLKVAKTKIVDLAKAEHTTTVLVSGVFALIGYGLGGRIYDSTVPYSEPVIIENDLVGVSDE